MKIHEDRRTMFESIGHRLVESLNTVSSGKTDRKVQGDAGEREFQVWLKEKLPKRYEVYSGTVVSPKDPPVTERDCLIFDAFEHPPFRVSGREADMFPIEGVAASIELSTGKSGTPYQKIEKDAAKVSALGQLRGTKRSPMPMWLSLIPSQGDAEFRHRIAVEQELPDMPPLLLIFVETLRGKLNILASRICEHNKRQSIESSVDGVFVLNKGIILHAKPTLDEGWSDQRQAGHALVYMESENWEVLLLMMMIIWNHLAKRPHLTTDLGRYYMDLQYFLRQHRDRIRIVADDEYVSQETERIPISGNLITLPIKLVTNP